MKAPYLKSKLGRQYPEYHETRETLWEVGGTTPQAYILLSDRSSKVLGRKGEKNPVRGVKENLKPCVYKLWKHFICATAYFL